MNLQKIAKICKENKSIIIYDVYDEENFIKYQCVSNGAALYMLYDINFLDCDNILTIFGVPADDKPLYHLHKEPFPDWLPKEYNPDAQPIELYPDIMWNDRRLIPAPIAERLVFLDFEFFKPLDNNMYLMQHCTDYRGCAVIAVCNGMIIQAYIMPRATDEVMNKKLAELGEMCAMYVKRKEERATQ